MEKSFSIIQSDRLARTSTIALTPTGTSSGLYPIFLVRENRSSRTEDREVISSVQPFLGSRRHAHVSIGISERARQGRTNDETFVLRTAAHHYRSFA